MHSLKPIQKISLSLGILVLLFGGYQACFAPHRTYPPDKPQLSKTVTIYFTKSAGNKSVTEAVARPIPQDIVTNPELSSRLPEDSSLIPLYFALHELLKGPSDDESVSGFFSEIPKGTRLIGITRKKGKIQVNLSKQFAEGGGANSIIQRMAELTETVQSVEKEQPIEVLVNGQALTLLGGDGLEVPAVIQPDIR